jgi:hypothetical protein
MMQKPVHAGVATFRLANPFLDLAIAGAEAQLKFWQAYQVEGAAFIARRMRTDLEFLRALGHCSDIETLAEGQWAWLGDLRKDYAEEFGRLVGTTFALGVSDIAPMGWLCIKRDAKNT